MQPAPSQASQNIPSQQNDASPSPTSHHGQLRDDDLQDSLQPHTGEPQGPPGPPTGGTDGDATRPDGRSAAEDVGLSGVKAATPPPRDRISEYENARVKAPRKPSEGPLFEVLKSNRKPDDTHSPIATLPNGESTAHCSCHICVPRVGD